MKSHPSIRCSTLLICHDVLRDPNTDSVHLIGVGNALRPREHRLQPSEFCVFLVLNGITQPARVSLACTEESGDQEVFATPIHFIDAGGKRELRLVMRIRKAVFPQPGSYRLQCFVDEFLVSEILLSVLSLEGD